MNPNKRSSRSLSGLIAFGAIAVLALVVATGTTFARDAAAERAHPGGEQIGPCRPLVHAAIELDGTLNDLVAEGTLEQAQADAVRDRLRQRAATAAGQPGSCGGALALAAAVSEVSEQLGLTPAQLRERFLAGQSLAEIAAEQGVARAQLVDLLRGLATERLDEAATGGRMSTEERDALEVLAFSRIERLIDHHVGDRLLEPVTAPDGTPSG